MTLNITPGAERATRMAAAAVENPDVDWNALCLASLDREIERIEREASGLNVEHLDTLIGEAVTAEDAWFAHGEAVAQHFVETLSYQELRRLAERVKRDQFEGAPVASAFA